MAIKITDLIDPNEIEKLKQLDDELSKVLDTYTKVAKDLAKGLDISVNIAGDIDKLEKLFVDKGKEAATVQRQLTQVIEEQNKVIANTTNTASRYLMERERENKLLRDNADVQSKARELVSQIHGDYQQMVQDLALLGQRLKDNSAAQRENEKAFKAGRISSEEFYKEQSRLIAVSRELKLQKSELTKAMSKEEKMTIAADDSYKSMSQQLEILKDNYKSLSTEQRQSDFGKDLEATIQNLDAHLKDMAADMGEFQRNVGNYAIACSQGTVTTEELQTVLSTQATTQAELIEQNKALEAAKQSLSATDANYQETVDMLNAKLEENRVAMLDVESVMNTEVSTVAQAEDQNRRLAEAIKHVDTTTEEGLRSIDEMQKKIEANNEVIERAVPASEKAAKAEKELAEVKKRLEREAKETEKAIKKETDEMKRQQEQSQGLASGLLGLTGINVRLGSSMQGLAQNSSGNFIEGLNTSTKAFGKTLLGLLANPWVLGFLGIAGVVATFKWWYDYNKGLIEASRLTQNFTGLTGDAADKITADTAAIADHMGKSFEDTIGAANTLVQQFGISWEEALVKIEDGIEAGADMNGRFVENINQFAPALRDAGVSVDEFVSILAETRNGIFDEKGVQDIIKGGTRLRAMTTQVAESLDACGISSKQMQKDLEEGNITMLEAVQQVSAKLKELPENSQEAGQVIKNVFGRTAAEGGTLLIQSLADVNTNLDEAKERMGDLGRVNREQMEAQKELNETLAAVFKMSGTSFEEMTIQAKTYIVQGLTNIIKGCVDIVNWFIRMYNKSIVVRGAVNSIVNSFKILWGIAKFVLNQVVDSFKALGTVIEGVVSLDWEKVTQGWKEGMNALKGNVEAMAKNMASNTADAINKTLNGDLREVSIDVNANLKGVGAGNPGSTPKSKPNGVETDAEKKAREKAAQKSAKEAEKQAKEELKRINELEESKIALMADGHEKELAMIRLKYKKKIDEIRKNGETENALRLQLSEQCQKEIEDCELKYQQQLAKINLENRLAAAKEGSKEELSLRLDMLEARRDAEIEAARKTGADVSLINAKFDKERRELENDYADRRVEEIQKSYATQQSLRDNEMMEELNALQKKYSEELIIIGNNEEKQAELKEHYDNETAKISERYAKKSAQATIDMLDAMLKEENLSAEERERIEIELAAAKIALEKAVTEATIAENERKVKSDNDALKKRLANAQQWLQVASDSLNSINELVSTVYDAKISKIEEEQEANTAAGEAEVERITELVEKKVITEEEGEARKRAAEAQTAKRNEEFEKKKQQLKHKQAVWDKANSLAQAGIATALAITQALPNVILAAIAGAMGALQIATILATPIPKYAKGTDRHKGGPAIVGDGGVPELVIFGGKSWITPDTPTIVDLPAGAIVKPNIDGIDDMTPGLMPLPTSNENGTPVIINNDYKRLEEKMDTFISIMRRHSNRQRQQYIIKSFNHYVSDRL